MYIGARRYSIDDIVAMPCGGQNITVHSAIVGTLSKSLLLTVRCTAGSGGDLNASSNFRIVVPADSNSRFRPLSWLHPTYTHHHFSAKERRNIRVVDDDSHYLGLARCVTPTAHHWDLSEHHVYWQYLINVTS